MLTLLINANKIIRIYFFSNDKEKQYCLAILVKENINKHILKLYIIILKKNLVIFMDY
jgi:hypothetical protein